MMMLMICDVLLMMLFLILALRRLVSICPEDGVSFSETLVCAVPKPRTLSSSSRREELKSDT
jgi:hypothetical protein